MYEYRVSKYDPKHRDVCGRYLLSDWTSISDIGKEFAGNVLTEAMYHNVETAYLDTAMAFIRECGVAVMHVKYLPDELFPPSRFRSGDTVQLDEVRKIVCSLLREEYWCELEAPDGTYISVGYDYLMAFGSPRPCIKWQSSANSAGLFVERVPLPYQTPSGEKSCGEAQPH